MAHRPAVKTQGLASFGVGPGIASRGCDLPAPDIRLPLPALISPQRGVLSDPFNSSSSIITCKVVILNQYTYDLFLRVLTFPPPVAKTLTHVVLSKKRFMIDVDGVIIVKDLFFWPDRHRAKFFFLFLFSFFLFKAKMSM